MDRIGTRNTRPPRLILLTPEQHGIEFGYVGGDPAELMRICVENGTFTVAFLKEGVQKVRHFLKAWIAHIESLCSSEGGLMIFSRPHGKRAKVQMSWWRVQAQWEDIILQRL